MHTTRLRRLNRWQAETRREDLADLYVESVRTRSGEEYRGREAFLRRLTGDIRRPGFALLVAEDTGFAGCVFGFPVGREGTWWKGFCGPLPRNVGQLTASGHAFAITDTVVHPHARGQDIARRLQERLLADHHSSLGATLVDQDDVVSLAAFRSWGWRDIGEVRRSGDRTVLLALVLSVGPRTAIHPDGLTHEDRTQRPD
jgi:GNAT superfamily N-acetyltransferase